VQAFKSGRSLLKARSERDAVFWAASQAPNIDLAPSPAHMVAKEPVAQPVEHLTFNQGVMGSNPIGLTNQAKPPILFSDLEAGIGKLDSC
jgi:hypothetical protein